MHLVLAHGGAGGLIVESFPVVAIGALWLWVWRRSKRADVDSAEVSGAGAAGPDDEASVEERRG